jgi:hypothetical protein
MSVLLSPHSTNDDLIVARDDVVQRHQQLRQHFPRDRAKTIKTRLRSIGVIRRHGTNTRNTRGARCLQARHAIVRLPAM